MNADTIFTSLVLASWTALLIVAAPGLVLMGLGPVVLCGAIALVASWFCLVIGTL